MALRRLPLPGCWYGEACYRADGSLGYWASTIAGGIVKTERGQVITEPLLFTRGHPSGRFAGQSHLGSGNLEYQESGGPGVVVGSGYGVNTVLYTREGALVQGAPQYGSQGLRYEADDGTIVTGDQTHLAPDGLLADYTELHGIRVGQDQIAGLGAILQVLATGQRYLLESGDCQFIRYTFTAPDRLAIYCVKLTERQAVAIWLSVADIATLPAYPVTPLRQPTFRFDHPVLLAPIYAAGSGRADLRSYGIYTEDPAPAIPAGQRLILVHDASTDWDLPSGLRPFDLPLIEAYRVPAESLDQSVARWTRQLQRLLAQWPGVCGVVPMAYTQNRWTTQQVLDGLSALSTLVALSSRVQVIAPFAYARANGITGVPDLQPAWQALAAAADRAGLASLPPVALPSPPTPPASGQEAQIMSTPQVSGIIHYQSKKASSRPGCTNYLLANGTVFSAQSDGSAGERPPGTDGPWEQGQESGSIATFRSAGTITTWLLAPIDKLP